MSDQKPFPSLADAAVKGALMALDAVEGELELLRQESPDNAEEQVAYGKVAAMLIRVRLDLAEAADDGE